jgi:hypothetical protein
MAFSFYSPPTLSPEQASPLGNLLGNSVKKYMLLNQAQYQPKMLEQELLKSQLFNKYYGPNVESEMGLRNAQKGLIGAQTGKIPYEIQGLLAQAQSAKALADKRRFIQESLANLIGRGALGGNNSQEMPSLSAQNTMSAPNQLSALQSILQDGSPQQNVSPQMQNIPMATHFQQQSQRPQQLQQFPQQQPQFGQQTNIGLTYPEAALASKELFGMQPKFLEVNGQHIAVTPFGNIPIAQGLSEREKELTKSDVKKISDLEDVVIKSQPKIDTLNEVSSLLSSPTFEHMREHPISGKYELGLYAKFGTPEEQKLVGDYMAYTGQIIKDSARDFAGQFRVGEQNLLFSMKPQASDSIDVMKGKTQALLSMTTLLSERSKIESQLMREKGYSPLQAKQIADKIIDTKAIKDEIKEKLYPERKNKLFKNLSNEDLMKMVNSQ